MISDFASLMLYFTVYALAGYQAEVLACSIDQKKLVNRGFLFGPVVPLYGFGAIMTLLIASLRPIYASPVLLFLVVALSCSLLEYATSFVMEKMYGVRLWDYHKYKLQINGRVCLRNTLAFGAFGVLIVYFIQPVVASLVSWLSPEWQNILAYTALALFLLDTLASTYAALRSKNVIKRGAVSYTKVVGDQTSEVKRLYLEAIKQLFSRKETFESRVRRVVAKRREKLLKELEKQKKNLEKGIKQLIEETAAMAREE